MSARTTNARTTAVSDTRSPLDTPRHVATRARGENFPVASRLLPSSVRHHLLALYTFARLVDDVGDEAAGDRAALLDRVEADLDRIAAGASPDDPRLQGVAGSVWALELPMQPLRDLVEANRRDQVVQRYATFAELEDYCRLSANPVGVLVLQVFGAADDERIRRSDAVCTALQVIEHCQDVREDALRGRVYLPADDMARAGCRPQDLIRRRASPAVRTVVAHEAGRARALLLEGAPLVGMLHGPARIACAGFVAGGMAALDALRHTGYDVLARAARPSRPRSVRHMLLLWAKGGVRHDGDRRDTA